MKPSKKLRSLIALAVMAGSVAGGGTAWADPINIVIDEMGNVSDTTYSNGNYRGVDASSEDRDLGDNVNSIKTDEYGTPNETTYGIYAENWSVTAESLAGGIDVNASKHDAYGISLQGTGISNIKGLGSISASAAGNNKTAYGIFTSGGGDNFSSAISFVENGSGKITVNGIGIQAQDNGKHSVTNLDSISASCTGVVNNAYGIVTNGGETFSSTISFVKAGGKITAEGEGDVCGISVSGTNKIGESHSVTNLGSISATGKITGSSIASVTGISTSGGDANFSSAISFVEAGGTITAKGWTTGGINAAGNGTHRVTNLGSINADGATATGISTSGGGDNFSSAISFVEAGGTITAKGSATYAYGINGTGSGTHSVTNLGSISATGKIAAYGIRTQSYYETFISEISFVEAGGTITATASGGYYSAAYGIYAAGKNKSDKSHSVTNLTGISAKITGSSGKAYGIYTNGSDSTFSSEVTFVGSGSIEAAGSSEAYGIYAEKGCGSSSVENLGSLKATSGNGKAYGICSNGKDASFSSTVKFTGADSGIEAKSEATSGGEAYGIYAASSGKHSVTNLGSVKATSDNGKAYGIYSNGSDSAFNSEVSFAGSGSIEAAGSSEACGIYAAGFGKHSVTSLGSLKATGSSGTAYGIWTQGSDSSFSSEVSFAGSGKITATADYYAYGIYAKGTNKSSESHSVANLTGISAKATGSSGNAYGIYTCGDDSSFSSTISFTGSGSIEAAGSSEACGIYAAGFGKHSVTSLGSLKATGSSGTAYGIWTQGSDSSFEANISFKGNDGEVITVKAESDSGTAYSIYDRVSGVQIAPIAPVN